MKYEICDTVELFQTKEKVKVSNIVEGVIGDIWGSVINTYKLEGKNGLYVDIYDGTVGKI